LLWCSKTHEEGVPRAFRLPRANTVGRAILARKRGPSQNPATGQHEPGDLWLRWPRIRGEPRGQWNAWCEPLYTPR
jgi:hypothetical protein